MSLEHRWQSLWKDAGGPSHDYSSYAYTRLAMRYSEPQRHYHTLAHITHCLHEFDRADVAAAAVDRVAVKMALWFHDVVYDPQRYDNEQRSAGIAHALLDTGGIPIELVERVVTLVLATTHTEDPKDDDEAVLIDVDLSILGQRVEVFDEYERQIRLEYSFVPEVVYREKRAEILQRFLDRPNIFHTAPMRKQYEMMAWMNLEHSIQRLTSGSILRT